MQPPQSLNATARDNLPLPLSGERCQGLAPALLQQLVLTENQLGEQLVHLNSGRQLLEELLLLGANFSARTALGALPLHTVAGLSDASQTLELLARYSEDVASARDSRGRFCAHYAAAAGASGNLRWLREQGADLRARDYELLLPLELAFAGGHFDLVPVFAGDFPLEAAAGSGNVSLVQQLVLDGYSPHEVDERARTAIFEALEKDRVDVAQFLASQNASLTLLDVSGLSPLAAAVRFQRSASLEFLVAQNVPVTQRLANASTALHLAAAGGREIIDLLVRAGADVNAVDMLNRSALHFCTNAGAVEALLAANASHLPSLRGLLPLHVAAVEGRVEALEALLASRTTQVDAVDFSGNTPLHLAVAAGQAPAAQVLLRWCASALTLNQDGQAPVQLARTVQMQDVLDQPAERCQCDCGSLRFDPLMVTGTWQSCSTTVRNCMNSPTCCDPTTKCYAKDEAVAVCLHSCAPGIHLNDPPQYQSPWTCRLIGSAPSPPASLPAPAPSLPAPAPSLPAPAPSPAPGSCTPSYHVNCMSNTKCCDERTRCYAKDAKVAVCLHSCTPGIHLNDPPQWQTPWTCDLLGGSPAPSPRPTPPSPPPPTCTPSYSVNCMSNPVCCDPSTKCYVKDPAVALCLHSCTPGINPNDPPQWQTPWSCDLVRPVTPAPTTTAPALPEPTTSTPATEPTTSSPTKPTEPTTTTAQLTPPTSTTEPTTTVQVTPPPKPSTTGTSRPTTAAPTRPATTAPTTQAPTPSIPSDPLTQPSDGKLLEFYMYRAQSDAEYTLENINAGNLEGMMWYLQNEVLSGVYGPGAKFGITRILRLKVTMKATQPLLDKGMSFGIRVAFDSGKCTGPDCEMDWQDFGYNVGCNKLGDWPFPIYDTHFPGGIWYSLPGACPSQSYLDKDGACQQAEPGGKCESPTGAFDCTWSYESAGQVQLTDLYENATEEEFWAGNSTEVNLRKVAVARSLFQAKYGADPPVPPCDFKRSKVYG
ncbi:unnamed protein product [Effrenium voratum]|nr:unnamed protein product [Effrenium voratum]